MTNMLYSLMLFDERQEGFFIGLFELEEKTRQVAEHYLFAVPGFRDYLCTYEIRAKMVIGTIGPSQKVHMIWGWNEDAEGNEVGIWSSECYADYEEAQRALAAAKQCMNKQEWSLDTYRIGQFHWTEGFVRIFDSEQEICPQSDGQLMLPRGITGFWSVKTEPPPFLNEKAFRQMCYTLARENGGIVTEIHTDATVRNFYCAKIRKYEDSVFILQNIHYPYAAFARRDTSGEFVLVDQPEWFRLPGSQVRFLSLAELNQDWRGLCRELSPEELAEIRCWRSNTAGEIIFNSWD